MHPIPQQPGELGAVELALVFRHEDAHHLVESGIHQAARFGLGLRAKAFEEQMQAGVAIHDGELQARPGLTQAVFDHFEHIAPHAAQLHRFGSAEQQDAIHPCQQLAAAAHAFFALGGGDAPFVQPGSLALVELVDQHHAHAGLAGELAQTAQEGAHGGRGAIGHTGQVLRKPVEDQQLVALADDFFLQPGEALGVAEGVEAEIEVENIGDFDSHGVFADGIATAEPEHALGDQVWVGVAAEIADAGLAAHRW